jgi:hypothetical protein
MVSLKNGPGRYASRSNRESAKPSKVKIARLGRIAKILRPDAQLFLEYLFNLADLLLDFARELFRLAFVLQLRVVSGLPGCFLYFAFYFVELAFHLVLRARFHGFSPFMVSFAESILRAVSHNTTH